MKRYKIKLSNKQIKGIETITDNKEKQKKLMSILSYLIKYTDPETNKLTRSINKLYKMYILYHNNISRCYFFKLIKLLKENNIYINNDKKVDKKVDNLKEPQTVDTTTLEADNKKANNLTVNNIYTYTPYTVKTVKAIDIAKDLFEELKIKSNIIKKAVIEKIHNKILDNTAGAINYVMAVIIEKATAYHNMKVKYAKAVAKSKYSKDKNSYIMPASNNNKYRFNNFEARSYDYEALERKLLGWDNDN